MLDSIRNRKRLIHEDVSHEDGYVHRELIRLGMSKADGQTGLWIEVYKKEFLSFVRQSYPQVDCSGRFAHAAFLIGQGNYVGIHNHHLR